MLSLRKALGIFAITLAGILAIALITQPAEKDFISYWSAGKLLLQHADPYSYDGVLAMEKSQGYTEARPLIMRNPPWAMFLCAPLGLTTPLIALLLWIGTSIGCIFAFIRLQQISVKDAILAFLFAPALASLCSGQSSPFLLLGFSLFLYLHTRQPYFAGCSLLLLAIKPHLFPLFWIILLLHCITERNWRNGIRLLTGFVTALLAATGFAMLFDHQIWPQYIAMLHNAALQNEFLPTLSELLRIAVEIRAGWLIFVPTLIALPWALYYYIRHRSHWDWATHGMTLMMVSILTSPYGWFSDQIVLLPVMAYGLTKAAGNPRHKSVSTAIMVGLNSIVLFLVLVIHPALTSIAYAWVPVAWFWWFSYSVAVP